MEEYTEEVAEAVKSNFDYLAGYEEAANVIAFLEGMADCVMEGSEVLTQIANALRDVNEGVI